jgi:hypothetical protein
MAGALLASALGGGGAAVAADALVNTPLDRLADQAKGVAASRSEMPQEAQSLYTQVLGTLTSTADFMTAIRALEGSLDTSAGVPVETAAGKKSIAAAAQIQQENPGLAAAMAEQARQDLVAFGNIRQQGLRPEDVAAAAAHGAGTTMIPGLVAGIAGGGLGYGAGHALGGLIRRGVQG